MELKKKYSNSILMDCDDMRNILDNFDYSESGRNHMQSLESMPQVSHHV